MGEADIEALVREFFDEFGGTIKGVRPGPARSSGDIFRLEVPNVLTGDQIKSHYDTATFTKAVAMEEDEVDFIALDHPIVQSLIDYCLDSNRIQGEIAVKVAANPEVTPGILFNYRLGYVSGTGDAITEKFVRLYATREGTITTEIPEFVETLSRNDNVVNSCSTLDQLASKASQLHDVAEARAWDEVESFADEARTEREREIEIKREHAERYFADQINEWEERLETYQQRAEQGADMSAPIGNAKRELEKLRRQRNEELGQLEEEQHVTPEEPELVTAALVIPPGK